MKFGKGNRSTRGKLAPAPLCPPQIPLDQTRDRTRAAAVESQRLTAWAMARPFRFQLLGLFTRLEMATLVVNAQLSPSCGWSSCSLYTATIISVVSTGVHYLIQQLIPTVWRHTPGNSCDPKESSVKEKDLEEQLDRLSQSDGLKSVDSELQSPAYKMGVAPSYCSHIPCLPTLMAALPVVQNYYY
jgi:hypothetical protein